MADSTKSANEAAEAYNANYEPGTGKPRVGPASIVAGAQLGTTAGKGLGAKGNTAGLPKRADFDTQDKWMEAVRTFRATQDEKPEASRTAEGRKRALARMP
jgi:hypothetical protein